MDRTALLDEIRFTKQQMLAVAAFGLALVFGIFGLMHEAKLDRLERTVGVGTFLVARDRWCYVALRTSTPSEDNSPCFGRDR